LRKDRFPSQRKFKLSPNGDGQFQVVHKTNDNAYRLDLVANYEVSPVFNVCDLTHFAGIDDEKKEELNLRANRFQKGGSNGEPLGRPHIRSFTRVMARRPLGRPHIRSFTRVMARRIEEEERLQKTLLL